MAIQMINIQNQVMMIQKEDVEEELDLKEEFYEADREEVNIPEINNLIQEYNDIFRDELPAELPTARNVEHIIELKKDANSVQSFQYRLSPLHLEAIKETVEDLLKKGHIQPS